jgi:hypothetical protein
MQTTHSARLAFVSIASLVVAAAACSAGDAAGTSGDESALASICPTANATTCDDVCHGRPVPTVSKCPPFRCLCANMLVLSKPDIHPGEIVELTSFLPGTSVIDNGVGPVKSGFPATVSPMTTTLYRATTTDNRGNLATAMVTLDVGPADAGVDSGKCATGPTAPPSALTAPTATTPGSVGASMTLTWAAPLNHCAAIDSYEISATGNGTTQTATSTEPSYTFSGTLPTCRYPSGSCGASYSFAVRAHNAKGYGPWSPATVAYPRVSYLSDNLRGIFTANRCGACHGSATRPDLNDRANNQDYAAAQSEGPLMFSVPRPNGGHPFTYGATEYQIVERWVMQGSLE